ncbi:MAG TPA: hypothetical protein VMT20_28630 [Terriglobia bacterium]|nr:hypothetical protein [Terriglobia bacterium]
MLEQARAVQDLTVKHNNLRFARRQAVWVPAANPIAIRMASPGCRLRKGRTFAIQGAAILRGR